jgi:hypothetical protein
MKESIKDNIAVLYAFTFVTLVTYFVLVFITGKFNLFSWHWAAKTSFSILEIYFFLKISKIW